MFKVASEENSSRLVLGFWSRLGLVLGLGETRKFSQRKIDP